MAGLVVGRTRFMAWVIGVATLAAAGCGSATTPVTTPATAGPTASAAPTTASPTATATSTALAGVSGGAGDTSANPDATFICAASAADDSGTLLAYLTVAGTDATTAKSLCSALEGASGWTAISSIPAGQYLAEPGCHLSFEGGSVTTRIYTAKSGSPADTEALCNTLLGDAELPTLAP
ncbi:MAG: hypothetical protein ACLQT7_02985 [Candidatus Dormibacteria bacterium]